MATELGRRVVHATGTLVPGGYLLDGHVLNSGVFTWSTVRTVAVAGLLATAVLEAARLLGGFEHPIYDRLTREYEAENIAGYALYAVGGTATVFLFEPPIAVPALLMLTLGDPVSGLLSGDSFRRVARPRALAGMFAVSFLFAYPFVPAAAAVAVAAAATVADGVKPVVSGYVIDDNLTIPTIGGGAMWLTIALL